MISEAQNDELDSVKSLIDLDKTAFEVTFQRLSSLSQLIFFPAPFSDKSGL